MFRMNASAFLSYSSAVQPFRQRQRALQPLGGPVEVSVVLGALRLRKPHLDHPPCSQSVEKAALDSTVGRQRQVASFLNLLTEHGRGVLDGGLDSRVQVCPILVRGEVTLLVVRFVLRLVLCVCGSDGSFVRSKSLIIAAAAGIWLFATARSFIYARIGFAKST